AAAEAETRQRTQAKSECAACARYGVTTAQRNVGMRQDLIRSEQRIDFDLRVQRRCAQSQKQRGHPKLFHFITTGSSPFSICPIRYTASPACFSASATASASSAATTTIMPMPMLNVRSASSRGTPPASMSALNSAGTVQLWRNT